MAILSVYIASAFIMTISAAAYGKSYAEMKHVEREISKQRSFAAAEAGVQNALAQIGANAYTGFINTNTLTVSNFQAVDGSSVGNYTVTFSYPNQADWVTIQATATVDNETKILEGRVFLDSNLSKYLVYANTTDFSSGTGAQYGEPDMTDAYGDGTPDYPEYVPSNADDRASLYFTGDWTISGSGVSLYGDANAQGRITGDSGSRVHGDTYAGLFSLNANGTVNNDGVDGTLIVGDGFSDDTDRNHDGLYNATDALDRHDLTSTGGGDNHKTETITPISTTFYAANNNTPQFVGSSSQNRYLKFVSVTGSGGAPATQIVEYTSAAFNTVSATYTLPSSAIVYVKGSAYVKGEIGGRVSIVSTSSIYLDGNFTYSSGQTKADATHSTALLAKDKVYFRANDLTASGILYGENTSNSSAVFDATYNTSGASSPSTKTKLRLSGNRVMKGSTNLSIYPDRVYGYDSNLKYFRPPGIPVYPALRTIREK